MYKSALEGSFYHATTTLGVLRISNKMFCFLIFFSLALSRRGGLLLLFFFGRHPVFFEALCRWSSRFGNGLISELFGPSFQIWTFRVSAALLFVTYFRGCSFWFDFGALWAFIPTCTFRVCGIAFLSRKQNYLMDRSICVSLFDGIFAQPYLHY